MYFNDRLCVEGPAIAIDQFLGDTAQRWSDPVDRDYREKDWVRRCLRSVQPTITIADADRKKVHYTGLASWSHPATGLVRELIRRYQATGLIFLHSWYSPDLDEATAHLAPIITGSAVMGADHCGEMYNQLTPLAESLAAPRNGSVRFVVLGRNHTEDTNIDSTWFEERGIPPEENRTHRRHEMSELVRGAFPDKIIVTEITLDGYDEGCTNFACVLNRIYHLSDLIGRIWENRWFGMACHRGSYVCMVNGGGVPATRERRAFVAAKDV